MKSLIPTSHNPGASKTFSHACLLVMSTGIDNYHARLPNTKPIYVLRAINLNVIVECLMNSSYVLLV